MSTISVDGASAGRKQIANSKVEPKSSPVASSDLKKMVLTSLPLIVADLLSLAMATCLCAYVVRYWGNGSAVDTATILVPLAAAFLLVNWLIGLYPGIGLNPVVEFRQVTIATTLLFTVFGAAMTLSFRHAGDGLFLVGTWAFTLASTPVVRSTARGIASQFEWWGQPAIIFGSGRPAMEIYETLKSNPGLGLRPVGLVDDSYTYEAPLSRGAKRFSPQQASSTVRRHCVFWAIVAMPDRSREEVMQVIEKVFLTRYPHLLIVPNMRPLPSLWNQAHDCGGLLGIRVEERLLLPVPRIIKRGMDLGVSVIGGLVLAPLFSLICLLIKVGSPGPVFYCQRRVGFGGHHFQAWKFRTMVRDADKVLKDHLDSSLELRAEWERDHKLKNDPRVTWIGWWLRKTSLDELPQLWNVLRGQMSLVGPRPIVDQEIGKYGDTFERYAKVLPGVTGLWQISGRNNTSYEERVELDSYYVRNWSPWLDLFILIRTIKVVLLREGAY